MKDAFSRHSLFNNLSIFWQNLPSSLVNQSQLHLLKERSKAFPPIIRIGIECRMNTQQQVDLQQCIMRDKDDIAYLTQWLHLASIEDDQEWAALLSFFQKWSNTTGAYHQGISEIFFETDVLPGKRRTPLLFFSLDQSHNLRTEDFLVKVLTETLGSDRAFYPILQQCFAACPENASVFFAGIQFSRQIDVIRVNIKNLFHHQVIPFLQTLGYQFITEDFKNQITFAYHHCDRVRVCLDLGKSLLPKIGLECFWDDSPSADPRWASFLNELTTQGICIAEKADAVLNWDSDIFPNEKTHWPEQLWIQSLSRRNDELSFLRKKASHLKLSLCGEKTPELKAYLGFGNLWIQPVKKDSRQDISKADGLSGDLDQMLDHALARSCAFMLGNQLQSGFWIDFSLPPGKSDEWVTAYCAYYLSFLQNPEIEKTLYRAAQALKISLRKGEGWGYNKATPADADSTVWAHLFFDRIAGTDEGTGELLKRYIRPDGGVTTYLENDQIRENTKLSAGSSFDGWQRDHVCVTAAYALAGEAISVEFISKAQQEAGYFKSYWWSSSAYATCLAAEALAMTDSAQFASQITRAVSWATTELTDCVNTEASSPFNIALLLRVLFLSPDQNHQSGLIKRALTRLLTDQLADGSWQGTSGLRIPMPGTQIPEDSGNNWIANDQNRNFTTITVLTALNKYKNNV